MSGASCGVDDDADGFVQAAFAIAGAAENRIAKKIESRRMAEPSLQCA
jgi:hypothetical protein